MNPVRFALAGFGAWGKHHAKSIAAHPDARLAAICAPTEATRVEAHTAFPDARIFADPQEMIAWGGFDILDIVTPSHTHRDIALAAMHAGKHVLTPVVCWLPSAIGGYPLLLVLLPLFAFFAQGIHAGYAVYFPALFPTHLRATGAGFCFNTGRILAEPVLLWVSGWMKAKYDLQIAITCLGSLFLLGFVFLVFLPETKGRDLPEP